MMPKLRIISRYRSGSEDLPDLTAGLMKRRVGLGQPNLRSDVILTQFLLNNWTVMPRLGQAAPVLRLDGVLGPLTTGAVKAYQLARFGVSDGILSPGRPTIRALAYEAMIGASLLRKRRGGNMRIASGIPNPIDELPLLPWSLDAADANDMRANNAFALIPMMVATAAKVELVIVRARDLLRIKKDTPENSKSLALLAKHFTRRDEPAQPLNVYIDFIQRIISQTRIELSVRMLQGAMRGFFAGADAPTGHADWAATTYAASAWKVIPGIPAGGWINLYPLFEAFSPHMQITTVIHELAHGFGFEHGAQNHVKDNTYCHEPRYAELKMGSRVFTADTYGAFVHDAAFGSPDMLANYQHVEKFLRLPFVSNYGMITDP